MRRPARGDVQLGGAVALVTLVDFLAWLGWDHHRTLASDGRVTGAYHVWQLVGLAVVLALVADQAGRRGRDRVAAVAAGATMFVCSAVDSGRDNAQDGYFLIGAALVGAATYLGMRGVAWVGREIDAGRGERLRAFLARRTHLSHR